MIRLPGGEFQRSSDVLGFEIRIIFKDLFPRRASRKHVEDIPDPDAQTADAWSAGALIWAYCDAIQMAHVTLPD
jgi:hypothetical protein